MLFSKFWRHRPTNDSHTEYENGAANVKSMDYVKLEERRVLNATFAFDLMTAELTLHSFTDDAFTADRVEIEQNGSDYVFTLNDGFWQGLDSAQVSGNGSNVLFADRASVDLVNLIGNSQDSFDIQFGNLTFDGEFNIATLGGFSQFGLIGQQANTELLISSSFSIDGATEIDLQNSGNDFFEIAIENVGNARLVDESALIVDTAETGSILSISANGISTDGAVTGQHVLFHSSGGFVQQLDSELSADQLIVTGSGSFELWSTTNHVERFAADVSGSLNLNNQQSIELSELTIDSTNVSGIHVDGDFRLTTADADVFQTSKIVVSSTTYLDVGMGHICLSDGDSDGDGRTNNNFFRIGVIAEQVDLIDRNGIIFLDSDVVDRLGVVAGDTDADLSDGAGGRITLDGNLYVGNAILFQASSGVRQMSGFVQTDSILLGGEMAQRSSGNFVLDGTNAVSNLAADLRGDLTFSNNIDLNFASLNFAHPCGTMQVISNHAIAGQLDVQSLGDIKQDAAISVASSTRLTANGNIGLVNTNNDFMSDVAATAATIELVDSSDLRVNQANAIDQIYLRSGAEVSGSLVLDGTVTSHELVLLQSSNGVQQNSGAISTSRLMLGGDSGTESSGDFILRGPNFIESFAYDVDGKLQFSATTSFEIVDSTYVYICETSLAETISQSSASAKAALMSDESIVISTQVSSPKLLIDVGDGIQQTASGKITTDQLILNGRGLFDLGAVANEIDEFAADIDGDLSLNDTDGIMFATIEFHGMEFNGVAITGDAEIVTNGDLHQQTAAPVLVAGTTTLNSGNFGSICLVFADSNNDGINDNDFLNLQISSAVNADVADANRLDILGATANGQLRLVAGSSDVNPGNSDDGTLTLRGDLSAGTKVLLQASSGVMQFSGTVASPELLLGGDPIHGTGDFNLQSANAVRQLAVAINGGLRFENSTTLTVDDLSFHSTCDSSSERIAGISTTNHDAIVKVGGTLILENSVDVGLGTAFFETADHLQQTSEGAILASELGVAVGGDVELFASNEISSIAGITSGAFRFKNSLDLKIGSVAAFAGTSDPATAIGLATSGDIELSVLGDMELNAALRNGFANTHLAVAGDLNQSGFGLISTHDLGLIVAGDTVLELDNDVVVFAANTVGAIVFNDINEVAIATANVFSDSSNLVSVAGVMTSGSDVVISVADDLEIKNAVLIGNGNAAFVVGQNLSQNTSGLILANELGLVVGGTSHLASENDVNTLAAMKGGFSRFGDVDDLTIGTVSVFEGSPFQIEVAGVQVADNDFKVELSGDLFLAEELSLGTGTFFVSAGGEIGQSASGNIIARQLGMMVSGQVRLDAQNDVDRLAGNNSAFTLFNDVNELEIAHVEIGQGTVDFMSVAGLQNGMGSAKLVVADDLLISETIGADSGVLLLDVGGDLLQTSDGTLSAAYLGTMVDGTTNLLAQNMIEVLAADNLGATNFINTIDLSIGSVALDGMQIANLSVANDLTFDVFGDLVQTQAIVVVGDTVMRVDGKICLNGAVNGDAEINENDFIGTVSAFAGTALEIEDATALTVVDATAEQQIRFRSGDGGSGELVLLGRLETLAGDGRILLQSDSGVIQAPDQGSISTHDLMLGSSSIADARQGDFMLNGINTVENIAVHLVDQLQYSNFGDLNIAPLTYDSRCDDYVETFNGLYLGSVLFNVSADGSESGSLTDAADAQTIIMTAAHFQVTGMIELGDGFATLDFADHDISNLLGQNVAPSSLTIGVAASPAHSASLFIDSSVILGDVFVSDRLFIDTIEGESLTSAAGDILQTMNSDLAPSSIFANDAIFVSRASVQLTNTYFDRLAIESSRFVSSAIDPFSQNTAIDSTFTGSIDADVFANDLTQTFLLAGDSNRPVNGVFNVGQRFIESGFELGNNEFVNSARIGAIIVNNSELNLVSFDSLDLSIDQLQDVVDPAVAARSLGDVYVETQNGHHLNVISDVSVTSGVSNITAIAGNSLTLSEGAEFSRSDAEGLIGRVNRLQSGFSHDAFIFDDPRSVIDAPGDAAFSDVNSQLDSAIGFQDFRFYFGNPGEKSFNLIIGWFVDFVTPSQAIDPAFQQTLVQQVTQTTAEFLLVDFANFGQPVSAYTIGLESQLLGAQQPLALTNGSQFDQLFFGDRSYLLSQAFLTNDARINLFEDGGTTDLNFTEEVLPTRTVVENPEPIVVATPTFEIPESVGALPQAAYAFVNLIQDPENPPIVTEQQPESFFLIRYTADDDGVFEESFKWSDANDDPDAIRAAIEDAQLFEGEDNYWPETSGEGEGGWFEKIKQENKVRPGLYFIFEVQEGQLIPEPVDAPVDRTDIENLLIPDEESTSDNDVSGWMDSGESNSNQLPRVTEILPEESSVPTETNSLVEKSNFRFSAKTRHALLGSSLLLAQSILIRNQSEREAGGQTDLCFGKNVFSRASRWARRQFRNQK